MADEEAGLGTGGGWFGGTTEYGGFGSDGDLDPVIPGIKPNVLNIDDSIGRLGCGVPSYFITSRCSGTLLCVLENVTRAEWGRKLDEVSAATVEVSLSGDNSSTCCQCLAEAEPWCHELHIWRDGEEVWVGPIQELEYSYEKVIIRAKDSLSWLSVRILPGNINYTTVGTGLGAAELTEIGEAILTFAFGDDAPDFTCEVDNIYTVPTGRIEERFYEGFNQTSLDIFRLLADSGLDFTTVGRTIVMVGDETPLTPLVLLNDEHIHGDITVVKDGLLQGNRYYIHFEGDEGLPVVSDPVDFYCYTAIERIMDGEGLQRGSDALITANAYASASAIAPRIVEIPDGSRLSPDTPWTINQMVCGARVDVTITRLCLELTQSFRLTSVDVVYDNEGESIGITLTPITNLPLA